MRKIQFINENIYHVYNRGADKRTIFLDTRDYLRMIHDLWEFNDSNPSPPPNVRFQLKHPAQASAEHLEKSFGVFEAEPQKQRDPLIEIMTFALMPNHFHLLIRQKQDKGIQRFMQKLGTGYTMYFNTKYQHLGHVFQGKFKAVIVEHERQLIHLPYYIHLNPLDLKYPSWRKAELENAGNTIKYLQTYRWSSHLDYLGQKNFPPVTQREFLLKIFGGAEGYKKEINKWLQEREKNLNLLQDLALE